MQTTTTFPAFANYRGYSDCDPYEVVRVISDKCVEIREMNAEMDKSYRPERIPGGFAGHCINQDEQKWVITPNPNAPIKRIRLHKDGRWYDAFKGRYSLSDSPRKYYDFNF